MVLEHLPHLIQHLPPTYDAADMEDVGPRTSSRSSSSQATVVVSMSSDDAGRPTRSIRAIRSSTNPPSPARWPAVTVHDLHRPPCDIGLLMCEYTGALLNGSISSERLQYQRLQQHVMTVRCYVNQLRWRILSFNHKPAYKNSILFTLLLVHLILRISSHHTVTTFALTIYHYWPFTPDLKLV